MSSRNDADLVAVRHGCSFTGVFNTSVIIFFKIKILKIRKVLSNNLNHTPSYHEITFPKQDSLGSTSLGKVCRLGPTEKIGLTKAVIDKTNPSCFCLIVGGWFLQSGTPPPPCTHPSTTCTSLYFLISVYAGLKLGINNKRCP